MAKQKLIFWGLLFSVVVITLYIIGVLSLIPLVLAVAILYGLFPFLIGAFFGFIVKRANVSIASIMAVLALLLLIFASPELRLSYGHLLLNPNDFPNSGRIVWKLVVSIVWYGVCGAIGGEFGEKIKKRFEDSGKS